MSPRRWALVGSGLAAALGAAAALAFGPVVRSVAASQAARFGASLTIASVRPAWGAARLLGVDVRLADVPALSIHLDELRVAPNRSCLLEGGEIVLDAGLDELTSQIARWRSAHRASGAGAAPGRARPAVRVRGLALRWAGPFGAGSSLAVRDIQTPDALHPESLSFGSAELRSSVADADVTSASIAWRAAPAPELRSLTASAVRAVVRWQDQDAPAPAGAPARAPNAPNAPSLPPPSLRDRLGTLASAVASRLASDARVRVDGLETRLERRGDRVTLGPGVFALERKDGVLIVDLAPGAAAVESTVTFRAALPLGAGPAQLDVVGGPVTLRALGVRAGDLGLRNLDKALVRANAHLTLPEDGRTVFFSGIAQGTGIALEHPKLADRPVEGLSLAAKLRGSAALDGSSVRLEEAELDVGAVQIQFDGALERVGERHRIDVRFGVPLVSCQAALDALPEGLAPVLVGMRAAGTLSLRGVLRFDPARPAEHLFEYAATNDCRFLAVPPQVEVARFRGPFRRRAWGPKGEAVELESGPGTPAWVSSAALGHFLEAAVMTTEDGGFRRHHGFDHEAIRNSVRENLVRGAFVRGASTISMQLAKNLYLDRGKTVSRKLQELVLTMYLEQALTKEQILELYLNVVEFGPMVYGIGPAAQHYFRTSPSSLSASQAMFLSSLLPSPSQQHFGAGGRLAEGRMRHLRRLLRIAEKMRWISADELEVALGEWVVYGSPAPERVGRTEGVPSSDESEEPSAPPEW